MQNKEILAPGRQKPSDDGNQRSERIWPQGPEDAPEWGNPRPGAPEAVR